MLELKDICKTFNPNTINAKVALNHLNLTLNDGDFVVADQYRVVSCKRTCRVRFRFYQPERTLQSFG